LLNLLGLWDAPFMEPLSLMNQTTKSYILKYKVRHNLVKNLPSLGGEEYNKVSIWARRFFIVSGVRKP